MKEADSLFTTENVNTLIKTFKKTYELDIGLINPDGSGAKLSPVGALALSNEISKMLTSKKLFDVYDAMGVECKPDDLIQAWNDLMPKFGFEYCRGLGSNKHLKNFINSTEFLKVKGQWEDLFIEVSRSSFLKGNNKRGWKASLLWLVDYDNALRVLNGEFKNGEMVGSFKGFSDEFLKEVGEK